MLQNLLKIITDDQEISSADSLQHLDAKLFGLADLAAPIVLLFSNLTISHYNEKPFTSHASTMFSFFTKP